MYKIIDYYTSKTIADKFETKEEASDYNNNYHQQAVIDKKETHNWLTIIKQY